MVSTDTLQTLEVFSDLSEEDLEQVSRIVIEKQVPKGQLLFVESVNGETLFVVLDGEVLVTRKVGEAGNETELYRAEAGDFLGAFSLVAPGMREVSAITLAPSTILIIRRKDLLKLAEKAPHAAFVFVTELMRQSLEKLREAGELHATEVDYLIRQRNGTT